MVELRKLFISCEHGGNQVPAEYLPLFAAHKELLCSHRGYDPGALSLAKTLAEGMHAPLEKSETTRLLVDLNRSRYSRTLFSSLVKGLSKGEKNRILEHYYFPYRRAAIAKIDAEIARGAQVVHLSVHSFTPNLDGKQRNADVGLLYDPQRHEERTFCRDWLSLLKLRLPEIRIRCNYPYRGTADGFIPALRTSRCQGDYLGIELEVNQGLLTTGKTFPRSLQRGLLQALQDLFVSD